VTEAEPHQDSVVLQRWHSTATTHERQCVLPDGCRDLIIRQRPGTRPVWFVSDLANRATPVAVGPGTRHTGYRISPGMRIDRAGLLASMRDGLSDAEITERLYHHVGHRANVAEALNALSTGTLHNIDGVARALGVQSRSLQRLMRRETGQTPVFWLRLARVRRCAARLEQAGSLAELAYDFGFADQAHMTRELRHWLGITPRAIRLEPDWIARHLGVGYGV